MPETSGRSATTPKGCAKRPSATYKDGCGQSPHRWRSRTAFSSDRVASFVSWPGRQSHRLVRPCRSTAALSNTRARSVGAVLGLLLTGCAEKPMFLKWIIPPQSQGRLVFAVCISPPKGNGPGYGGSALNFDLGSRGARQLPSGR